MQAPTVAQITIRKTFIQSVIFIIVSLETLVVSELLVSKGALLGAAASYLISMLFLLMLYIFAYIFEILKLKKSLYSRA